MAIFNCYVSSPEGIKKIPRHMRHFRGVDLGLIALFLGNVDRNKGTSNIGTRAFCNVRNKQIVFDEQ